MTSVLGKNDFFPSQNKFFVFKKFLKPVHFSQKLLFYAI